MAVWNIRGMSLETGGRQTQCRRGRPGGWIFLSWSSTPRWPCGTATLCYTAAKSGGADAALALSQDLLSASATASLIQVREAEGATLLPVTALEMTGFNAIPDAMAQVLGRELGWPVGSGSIIQNNKVGHTRAPSFNRLVTPAAFEGEVTNGERYVLVDDHVGLGGTLANLKGHIETNGGSSSP